MRIFTRGLWPERYRPDAPVHQLVEAPWRADPDEFADRVREAGPYVYMRHPIQWDPTEDEQAQAQRFVDWVNVFLYRLESNGAKPDIIAIDHPRGMGMVRKSDYWMNLWTFFTMNVANRIDGVATQYGAPSGVVLMGHPFSLDDVPKAWVTPWVNGLGQYRSPGKDPTSRAEFIASYAIARSFEPEAIVLWSDPRPKGAPSRDEWLRMGQAVDGVEAAFAARRPDPQPDENRPGMFGRVVRRLFG